MAVAVFGVIAAGLLSLVVTPLFSSEHSTNRGRAVFLAQEGLEATRAVRNDGWSKLTDGNHGLTKISGQWDFFGGSDVSADGYTRTITIEPVSRDVSGDIVETGGSVDPRVKKIISTVDWVSTFGIVESVSYSSYVMNWDNYSKLYDTDGASELACPPAECSGAEITGTGSGAQITIAPGSGSVSWEPSGGENVVHTTDTDWNSGTHSGTESVGSGVAANIRQSGMRAWTDYYEATIWTETTDTDFFSGTFNQSVVADTGDLGAVVINTVVDWNQMTSPTVSQMNDVYMFSTSDGWAVGNDGIILRWNGTAWSQFVDLGTQMFRAIDCNSSNDCWAAADSGRIARWNGTTWSQFVDLGGQTFDDIEMTSATAGWVVGNTGQIYRWNGTTWTAETSGTTANLTGVAGFYTGGTTGSVSETTDTDFNSASDFTNTVVTGTGASGSVVLTAPYGWVTQVSPTTEQFNAVWMNSSTDGWGVANGGVIARWNGTAWSTVTSPTTQDLGGVHCLASNNCQASGTGGQLIRWNGTAWSNVNDTGNHAYQGIRLTATNDGWAVADSGRISRFNGTTWSQFVDLGNHRFYQLDCVSSTNCWAAANSGRVARWNGTAWSQFVDTGNQTWYGIDMVSATDGWLVGSGGEIRRWNGTAWNAFTDTGGQTWYSVSMVSATDGWLVGSGGEIRRWNGTSWDAEVSPTGSALYSVGSVTGPRALAGGAGGTLVEYGPHYVGSGTYTSSVLDAGQTVNWPTVHWSETLPGGTDLTIATRTGPTATPDGSWSAWSAEVTDPAGSPTGSPTNRYIQYRATLTNTVSATPSLDSITLNYDTSTSTLFAVADTGQIFRHSGTTWSEVTDLGTHIFGSIACVTASDCWAVADSGRIARWNGATWSEFVDLGDQTFNNVQMLSSSNGWAVGSLGEIFRWNGTTWSAVTSPVVASLNGIHVISSTFGMAVGNGGVIIDYGYHYWSSATYLSSVYDSGAAGSIFSSVEWNELLPGGTDLTIATRTGPTATPDGSWSAWSAEVTDPAGSPITSPANRYIQYRVSLSTTNRSVTPRLNSITVSINPPAYADYYDLYMESPDDGWAAGCDQTTYTTGSIAHWDGNGWSNWANYPYCLDGMGGYGDSLAWAVDFRGQVFLRWNGTTWSSYDVSALTGGKYVYDVKCGAVDDCRASGTDGLMMRWNGTAWSVENSNTTENIEWISYVAANDIWASAAGGQILHYNGTTWSASTVGSAANSWHGIFMLSATNGFAVGGNTTGGGGQIYRWNGSSWTAMSIPTTVEVQNVNCISSTFCWAGGGYQASANVILLWNGTTWTEVASPITTRIKAIWTDSEIHAWGVANNGDFIEYVTEYPPSSTWLSPVVNSGAVDTVWNDIAWDAIRPISTDATVATRTGPTPTPDGSWSGWSSEYTGTGGTTIESPDNQYLQYRITFTSGNRVDTAEVEEVRIVHSALTVKPLYSLDGSDASDVWTVGDDGFIGHYDGVSWSESASPVSSTLRDVHSITSTDAVAVGSSGVILRWNGSIWSSESSPVSEELNGVSFTSAADGFAVGANGTIIRWNGSVWSTVSSPTAANLNRIDCDGTLNTCFAVGDGGVIIQWNGTAWVTNVSPVVSRLNGVNIEEVSSAWAVGDFGAVLQWDGATWSNITSPTTRNLHDVAFFGGGHAWICGAGGTVLGLTATGGPGTDGTYVSSVLDSESATSQFHEAFLVYSLPADTSISLAFRSGQTAVPDGSWSAWTTDASVADILPIVVPGGRYMQYRVTLNTTNPPVSPSVDSVEVTFSP